MKEGEDATHPEIPSRRTDPTGASGDADVSRYLNRELSWLDFNERVLSLARDPSLPLLERVRFVSIFSRNLDEFFQVRVAVLRARQEAGFDGRSPDGRSTDEELAAIRARVVELMRSEERVFADRLLPELAQQGIRILGWDDLERVDRKQLRRIFDEQLFPVLTPLAVDPAHPFPYVSNLSFNLGMLVRHPRMSTVRFARIKVPPRLPRFLPVAGGAGLLPVEQLIAAQLETFFPAMEIESNFPFRVTRDAELALEEADAEDLMGAIESGLHRRHRLSDAVRLEVDRSIPARARELLIEELELDEQDVYTRRELLDLGCLDELTRLERPELKFSAWVPRVDPRLSDGGESRNFFEVMREGDVLVHHPYDSFGGSVGAFLSLAADDPDVLAIKHTIYRTSGPENPVGRTLMRAARAGKQVVTLVELRARFDEQANIEWARALEQAGVHVVYGVVGLKTHGKIALVVRQEEKGIRRYCHVGTGNYNPETARLYEDVGLFTASPEIGADLSELFNHLTGYGDQRDYRKLLVAPEGLRGSLMALVRQEMEQPDGRIVIKCNGVSDPAMIDALYAASQAGVEIDLVVRGICGLRPGVPGLSENIRVRSILGRFLEHSRIFRFGGEARGPRYFIGSADLMPRNLDQRVEVVVPIEDPAAQQRLEEVISLALEADTFTWTLGPDGRWTTPTSARGVECQEELRRRAAARTRAH